MERELDNCKEKVELRVSGGGWGVLAVGKHVKIYLSVIILIFLSNVGNADIYSIYVIYIYYAHACVCIICIHIL